MTVRPLFAEWSDLVERASADRHDADRDLDDRTERKVEPSAPIDRLTLIRMRATRRT